jgi:hypothetical protein
VVNRNYLKNIKNTVDKNQFNQRVDLSESSTSQWFGRYSWTDELSVTPGLTVDGSTLYTRASQWVLSNTRVLSPTKVNEARFGYSSLFNQIAQELAGKQDVDAELGIPLKVDGPASWGRKRRRRLSHGRTLSGEHGGQPRARRFPRQRTGRLH